MKIGYINVINATSKIGAHLNGHWYLDYDGDGVWNPSVDKDYLWGAVGWKPVVGDWDGDGKAEVGCSLDGDWYLDYDGDCVWNPLMDKDYALGAAGWIPIIGKWI